jgi:hypothetical protein
MAVTDLPVDNGVNVEALLDVRDALADTPEIAQFQWRATCSWVKGHPQQGLHPRVRLRRRDRQAPRGRGTSSSARRGEDLFS